METRTVQVASIGQGSSREGKSYLKVQSPQGNFSVWEQSLWPAFQVGAIVEIQGEQKGQFFNVTSATQITPPAPATKVIAPVPAVKVTGLPEVAPQEKGLWIKETGLWLREGKLKEKNDDDTDNPVAKALKLWYYNEWMRVAGITTGKGGNPLDPEDESEFDIPY